MRRPLRATASRGPASPAFRYGRATIATIFRRAACRCGCRRPTCRHSCRSKASRAASVEPMVEPLRERELADLAVGHDDAILEASLQVGRRARDADRLQVLDDAGTGDLAGIVAAHAVGDDEQPALRLHEVAVLVQLADQAGMAQPATFDVEDVSHQRSHRPAVQQQALVTPGSPLSYSRRTGDRAARYAHR